MSSNTTETRNVHEIDAKTGNIYESVVIMSKRANQITAKMREEIQNRLSEFSSHSDALEEVFENREQIEISKQYERMAKPAIQAIDEFNADKIYYKNPSKEK